MPGRIDLHIHSIKSSDGDFSPSHIVKLASDCGLRAISISDHDTVAAYPEVVILGEKAGIEVIPSLELSTLFDNREFHLLLPFVEVESAVVKRLVDQVSERRFQEAKARVAKLQELGFKLDWKEVIEDCSPFPPLGVTIAQHLLKKAEDPILKKYLTAKNVPFGPYLFYKDYFAEGKPAFVSRRNVQLLDVLDMVDSTGAVAVLAHPGAEFQQTGKKDLLQLKARGLKGLEVYTTYHDRKKTSFYKTLAETLDLVPTVGSDFHGSIKPFIAFGSMRAGGYWMVDELQKRRP